HLTPVETRQLVDDCKPKSGTLHLLVGACAAPHDLLAALARDALAIVIDGDDQPSALAFRVDLDATPGPFACVVEQVPQHFLQILLFAAKRQPGLDGGDSELQLTVRVD